MNVAALNTTAMDGGAALSNDGHLLFFTSSRPGGPGSNDLYASRRADPKDDFAWEPPILLSGEVNTPAVEAKPFYLPNAEERGHNLYFNRGPNVNELNDIYVIAVTRDGETLGTADPRGRAQRPGCQRSGCVAAGRRTRGVLPVRPRSLARAADLWASSRRSIHDPWSSPAPVDALSSAGNDRHPML